MLLKYKTFLRLLHLCRRVDQSVHNPLIVGESTCGRNDLISFTAERVIQDWNLQCWRPSGHVTVWAFWELKPGQKAPTFASTSPFNFFNSDVETVSPPLFPPTVLKHVGWKLNRCWMSLKACTLCFNNHSTFVLLSRILNEVEAFNNALNIVGYLYARAH